MNKMKPGLYLYKCECGTTIVMRLDKIKSAASGFCVSFAHRPSGFTDALSITSIECPHCNRHISVNTDHLGAAMYAWQPWPSAYSKLSRIDKLYFDSAIRSKNYTVKHVTGT